MIIVCVCLIPYCIRRKQVIFPLTEELDLKVSSYCRHMHIIYLLVLCIVLLYCVSFKGLKKSLQLFSLDFLILYCFSDCI